MKGRYLKKLGSLFLAMLMVAGIVVVTSGEVQAQGQRRRVVVVRPYHRIYRPFGYRHWWGSPWGYDPFSPYGSSYRQYVFENGERALNQGYKDGLKTGKKDGKKEKSYDPQRSHYFHDSGFGNYAEAYRSGFSRGYQEGYRQGLSEREG